MTEYPKAESTGGFPRPLGPPCSGVPQVPQHLQDRRSFGQGEPEVWAGLIVVVGGGGISSPEGGHAADAAGRQMTPPPRCYVTWPFIDSWSEKVPVQCARQLAPHRQKAQNRTISQAGQTDGEEAGRNGARI